MSSAINAQLNGTFTSDGTVKSITLPSGYTEFEMINITDFGSNAANTNVMTVYATSAMAAGSALVGNKTSGATTIALPNMITSGGVTFVDDSGSQTPEAALTVTSATNASPPVLSMASTGNINQGDIVRYYNAAGQLNIAGMDFTAGTVVANTSVALAYMGAPGGAGTGGAVRRIPFDKRFYPRRRFITAITQASSAVITLSVTHGYTVGQEVRMIVPQAFGMVEMNGLLGVITAINTSTNTITVDINSTNFTAFAFPTSAIAALGVTFAQVDPVGEAAINSPSQPYGNLLDDATRNTSFRGVLIGTSAQTSAKLYQWVAKKGQTI